MKKHYLQKIIWTFAAIMIIIPVTHISYGAGVKIVQKQVPAYAKWGRLAMKETKSRYPSAEIVDYQHLGRVKSTKITTEKFKLWLVDGNKEFGVLITIEFDTNTEKFKRIVFKETAR